jgi:hypothetical protein
VVSATDPYGRNLGFLDPEPLLFHSSSSSIIMDISMRPVNFNIHFAEIQRGNLSLKFQAIQIPIQEPGFHRHMK